MQKCLHQSFILTIWVCVLTLGYNCLQWQQSKICHITRVLFQQFSVHDDAGYILDSSWKRAAFDEISQKIIGSQLRPRVPGVN